MRAICKYAIDRGVNCRAWVNDGDEYCIRHQNAMKEIDAFWEEVVATIKKALEK